MSLYPLKWSYAIHNFGAAALYPWTGFHSSSVSRVSKHCWRLQFTSAAGWLGGFILIFSMPVHLSLLIGWLSYALCNSYSHVPSWTWGCLPTSAIHQSQWFSAAPWTCAEVHYKLDKPVNMKALEFSCVLAFCMLL